MNTKVMKSILSHFAAFKEFSIMVIPQDVMNNKPVQEWPICDCFIGIYSNGFPYSKAMQYINLRHPFEVNSLYHQVIK